MPSDLFGQVEEIGFGSKLDAASGPEIPAALQQNQDLVETGLNVSNSKLGRELCLLTALCDSKME